MNEEAVLSRRRLLNRVLVALAGLAASVVAVPIVAFLLSPLLKPAKQVWRDVGGVNDFKVGSTTLVSYQDPSPLPWAGQTAQTAAWLRRETSSQFIAFSVSCAHLGCPVTWLPDADIFLCPCHGGIYYANGNVAGGPPPRPLFRQQVRVQNGRVLLKTLPLQVG